MKRFYATTSVTQGGSPHCHSDVALSKVKRGELFRSFYLDCTSISVDGELGYLRSISFTVEDAAIWVIEKKQEYENLVNRYERKSKMPYKASRQKNEKPFTSIYMNSPTSPLIQKICASPHDQQVAYFKEKLLNNSMSILVRESSV